NERVFTNLRDSKDAIPAGTKACLKGTCVALLQHIYRWAYDLNSPRAMLLSGAA
ncbi:hypothetical protein H0H92_005695, partial [Tricholoma furcatifolium]